MTQTIKQIYDHKFLMYITIYKDCLYLRCHFIPISFLPGNLRIDRAYSKIITSLRNQI